MTTDYHEKRNQLKNELARLSEQELRDRWQRDDYTLWEMEQEADRRGYHRPGDDYLGGELEQECELINEMLRERGLAEEARPVTSSDNDKEA